MKIRKIIVATGIVATSIWGVAYASDAVLVESSKVKITSTDMDARLREIPEDDRTAFRGNKGRIAKIIETLLTNRSLAQKAREEGMDKSAQFRKQVALQEEGMLAKAWLDKQVDTMKMPNFDLRARELYKLDAHKYEIPAQVHASHILVETKSRTSQEALDKAREIQAQLKQGEDFAALAESLSDDPSAKANKGDLGFFEAKRMVKPFSDAAFAMSKPGEISEPVHTSFGFHLIQFHEAKPAIQRPYEEVKDEIIGSLRDKYKSEYRQSLINTIKTDPTLKLHEAEIDKYYVDLDAIAAKQAANEGKK